MAIKSYSWVQRRVRTLNLSLGTQYSAKDIIAREKLAQQYGYSTSEYQLLEQIAPSRADTRAGDVRETDAGIAYVVQEFQAYAQQSEQIGAINRARTSDLIASDASVWRPIVENEGTPNERVRYVNIRTGAFRYTKPDGAEPATQTRKYKALKAVAKAAKATAKGSPANYYDDQPVNIDE